MDNNKEELAEEISLWGRLKRFYFAPTWQSLFAASYLFLFLYSAIFYLDNVFFALKFVFRTFTISTVLLSLPHVIWGAILVVALMMPFVISICMIFALPNIWKKEDWKKDQKLLATVLAFIIALAVIVIADDLIRAVASRDVLKIFIQGSNLKI
ncbi:MAG: hypothetical protein KAV41_03005 [Candidatus Pacebacteria bacterium]|nr:hypothetical protein [Candidatus Paceibacterota bacterium]